MPKGIVKAKGAAEEGGAERRLRRPELRRKISSRTKRFGSAAVEPEARRRTFSTSAMVGPSSTHRRRQLELTIHRHTVHNEVLLKLLVAGNNDHVTLQVPLWT
jgi:hypothetical protein